MSERGSFVTEYIYCVACFDAIWAAFNANEKYLRSIQIPTWGKNDTREEMTGPNGRALSLPIIAGKIGGLYPGEEHASISDLLNSVKVCHDVRVSVLCDNGCSHVIVKHPNGDVDDVETLAIYRTCECHRWRGLHVTARTP
jgi:hypothetical protein